MATWQQLRPLGTFSRNPARTILILHQQYTSVWFVGHMFPVSLTGLSLFLCDPLHKLHVVSYIYHIVYMLAVVRGFCHNISPYAGTVTMTREINNINPVFSILQSLLCSHYSSLENKDLISIMSIHDQGYSIWDPTRGGGLGGRTGNKK